MPSAPRTRTSYMAHRDGEPAAADDPLLSFAPVPHKQLRRNSIGPARQRKFIAALAATGIVSQAAKDIGASLEALYNLRQRPGAEGFRAAWDAAIDRGVQRVEARALKRATDGSLRPVVAGGRLLCWQRVHNEALVMFFLRQRRPERYGGPAGGARGEGKREEAGPPNLSEFLALMLQKIEAIERAIGERDGKADDAAEGGEATACPALPTPAGG